MDRRRNGRAAALLSVRIWGIDADGLPFSQVARTRNISSSGAVLQGVVPSMKAGEPLQLKVGQQQAEFRVVWVGRQGTRRQGEIGVQALDSNIDLWELNLAHCSHMVGKG